MNRFWLWMVQKGWLTQEVSDGLYERYKTDILQQMKASEKIQAPEINQLIEDVYYQPTARLKQQLEHLKEHIKKYPQAYPKTSQEVSS